MTKVYMFICVLLWQESEVWCSAVSCIFGENGADKFKLGGENAISKTCRQDVQGSSSSCQSFNGQITVTSVPFADSHWQSNGTLQQSCIHEAGNILRETD